MPTQPNVDQRQRHKLALGVTALNRGVAELDSFASMDRTRDGGENRHLRETQHPRDLASNHRLQLLFNTLAETLREGGQHALRRMVEQRHEVGRRAIDLIYVVEREVLGRDFAVVPDVSSCSRRAGAESVNYVGSPQFP